MANEPEILNEAKEHIHSLNVDTSAEEMYFLGDNTFFEN